MKRSVCNRNCWTSGAIAGVVVLLFASGIGDLGWGAGLFLGAVTAILFGALMVWLVCNAPVETVTLHDGLTRTDWEREAIERQPESLLVSAALGPDGATSATQMPIMAGAMPMAQLQAEMATPNSAAPKTADDLRRIKGVGPKLSDWLARNGVTRFDQIAAWDMAAIQDHARQLGRMGSRIEADDWVGQARILAAGGETEHSRRVQRGEAG